MKTQCIWYGKGSCGGCTKYEVIEMNCKQLLLEQWNTEDKR